MGKVVAVSWMCISSACCLLVCFLEKGTDRVHLQADLGKVGQVSQALSVHQDVLCWLQEAIVGLFYLSVKV